MRAAFLVLIPSLVLGASSPRPVLPKPRPEARLQALNLLLVRSSAQQNSARLAREGGLSAALEERGRLLKELMARNPARALSLALPAAAARNLAASHPASASSIEVHGTWEGEMDVLAIDNFRQRTGRIVHRLHTAEGIIEVQLPSSPGAVLSPGDRIRVAGIRLGDRIAATTATRVAGGLGCSTTGEQKTAVVLVTDPDLEPDPALTPEKLKELAFGNAYPSLTGYWKEASYGKTWAKGDVFGWYKLSKAIPCSDFDALTAAALVAADAHVDLSAYSRILFIYNTAAECGEALGLVGCFPIYTPSHGRFTGSMTTIDTQWFSSDEKGVAVMAHEAGHNLGLEHGFSRSYLPEPLGAPGTTGHRGEYWDNLTAMGHEGLGHYNARQKLQLGWLSESDVTTVTAPGAYSILPLESQSPGVKALRVQRAQNSWIWLEQHDHIGNYKLPDEGGYDGAVVHYEDEVNNDGSVDYGNGPTDLLDMSPTDGSYGDFFKPVLPENGLWSDPYTFTSIEVTSAGPGGMNVKLNQDATCATVESGVLTHGQGAETGGIKLSAAAGCQWSASTGDSWIHFTSETQGTGGGQLTYQLDAATGQGPRTGTIALGNKRISVVQDGTNRRPYGISITPNLGTGQSQRFVARITDDDSLDDLREVAIWFAAFDSDGYCAVDWQTGTDLLLYNDTEESSGAMGTSGTLATSNCALDLATAQSRIEGTHRILEFTMTFSSSFQGTKTITMEGWDTYHYFSYDYFGSWTVAPAPPVSAARIESLTNAASRMGGPIAVGEIVTISCPALKAAQASAAGSALPLKLSDVRVLFDGIPGVVMYTGNGIVHAIVPYGLDLTAYFVKLQLEWKGGVLAEASVPLEFAMPAIFCMNGSHGPALSWVTAPSGASQQAVPRRGVVSFLVTGAGPLDSDWPDTQIPSEPGPATIFTPLVTFAGVESACQANSARLVYPGIVQVDACVPAGSPTGNVPLDVAFYGYSQSGVTVSVQ